MSAKSHKLQQTPFWAQAKFWCPTAQTYVNTGYNKCPHCGKKVKP